MIRSYCYWQSPDDEEFEVHYVVDCGEIKHFELHPKPSFELSRQDERDIFELIYDDVSYGEEEDYG